MADHFGRGLCALFTPLCASMMAATRKRSSVGVNARCVVRGALVGPLSCGASKPSSSQSSEPGGGPEASDGRPTEGGRRALRSAASSVSCSSSAAAPSSTAGRAFEPPARAERASDANLVQRAWASSPLASSICMDASCRSQAALHRFATTSKSDLRLLAGRSSSSASSMSSVVLSSRSISDVTARSTLSRRSSAGSSETLRSSRSSAGSKATDSTGISPLSARRREGGRAFY
mmetsp:Transcript_27286/g.91713  ORF Transcript_27286/g.91713 Transcript_27286/m.91713 type:complete len:233 (-) Transcript_27286:30-728(-)